MKKTQILYLISILFLFACSEPVKNDSNVETLAKLDKTVIYEVSLEVEPDFANWMGNINQQKLVKNLFNNVKNNKLIAYDPMRVAENIIYTWDDIKDAMGAINDTLDILNTETNLYEQHVVEGKINLNEIKAIIFIEEWNMTKEGKIEKEVLGLAPVRIFLHAIGDSIVTRKRIVFASFFGDKKPPIFSDF